MSFPELAKILSLMCLSDDPKDNISLDAAVCLGKLCVADENAKNKLRQIVLLQKGVVLLRLISKRRLLWPPVLVAFPS